MFFLYKSVSSMAIALATLPLLQGATTQYGVLSMLASAGTKARSAASSMERSFCESPPRLGSFAQQLGKPAGCLALGRLGSLDIHDPRGRAARR